MICHNPIINRVMSDFKEERYVKRRVIVFLILLSLLLWVIRVVNLNREKESNVMYVEQGQEFYYGGLAIQADDFLLLNADEYDAYFDVKDDVIDGAKVACVQFTVRNDSENAISWDDVFSVMGEGFVCKGWGSAYDPFMGAKLNKFYDEQLNPGMQQDIWIVTTVSRVCFREKTWENLSDMEFEYVVSLYPDAVRIRLKTGKNYGGESL